MHAPTNESLTHAPQTTNQVEWKWGHLVFFIFSSANEIQCALDELDELQSRSQPQEQPWPSSSAAATASAAAVATTAAAEATTTDARKPSKGTARRRAYLLLLMCGYHSSSLQLRAMPASRPAPPAMMILCANDPIQSHNRSPTPNLLSHSQHDRA